MILDLKMEIEAIKKKHKWKEFWKWKIWLSEQELQMQASLTKSLYCRKLENLKEWIILLINTTYQS